MGFQVTEQLTPRQKERRAQEMIQWLEANGFSHLLAKEENQGQNPTGKPDLETTEKNPVKSPIR